jgi:hypothetical protein
MLVVFLADLEIRRSLAFLREQRTDNRPLRELQVWIVEHLRRPFHTGVGCARGDERA